MYKISIFCEDSGHEKVIFGLLTKLLPTGKVNIRILSARQGKGRALSEMQRYVKRIDSNIIERPDAIVVALDANCKGYNKKRVEIDEIIPAGLKDILTVLHAIPDPHVERWMLLDSKAFKKVFGKGCSAPDQKCEKDRYKKFLNNEIINAGGYITPGWIEHADDIIKEIDLETLCRLDDSVRNFIDEVSLLKKQWGIES